MYLPTYFGEDVLATLLAYAVELRPADFNGPGEVFGVIWKGLAFPPERLVELGYGVIHSVKSDVPNEEQQTRTFFRQLRNRVGTDD